MSNTSIKEKLTHVPETVVFLGAGASYPLEYPPTKEFIKHLQEALKRNGKNEEANLLHYILTRIEDIEDVEQVLQLLEVLEEHYTQSPATEFYQKFKTTIEFGSTYDLGHVINWIKGLKEEVEKEVFEAYRWRPQLLDKSIQLHQPLLNIINGKLSSAFKDIFIFTTNYDQVIEEAGNALEDLHVIDGFNTTRGGRHFWDPTVYNKQSDNTSLIKLFKLHGSLNWRERTDGKIERVATEERILGNQTYKRNILIYPTLTHKANHTIECLSVLYDYFKETMERTRCCIVIGYSFRDQNINKVFLDFISRKGTTLTAVSPSAERNVRKQLLKEDVKEDEKMGEASERNSADKGNIWMINRKFGEGQTDEEIRKYLDRLAPRAV